MGVVVVIAGAWTCLSLAALVLLRPLLQPAATTDREQDDQRRVAPGTDRPDDVAARRAERAASEVRRALQYPSGLGSEPEITALVSALAAADGPTWEHSLEVAELAGTVGERLGLSTPHLVEVHLAALLHDVGKIRLPRRILRKPGALDPEEWRLVRQHPEWGAELVASVPGLEAVADVVLLHHERPDGRGYPYGLVGEQIPIASLIVAACDAFGAMTGGRLYQEPLDRWGAVKELRGAAGTQFDEDVVDALASAVRAPRQPVSA